VIEQLQRPVRLLGGFELADRVAGEPAAADGLSKLGSKPPRSGAERALTVSCRRTHW
jgi:hypothetical protein